MVFVQCAISVSNRYAFEKNRRTKFELFAEYFVFQSFNDQGLNRSADKKSFIKNEEKGDVKKLK